MSHEELMEQMNKALGAKIIKLGSDPSLVVTFTPTGVLPMDCLLFGGLPKGRSVELFGPPSTLKSYIAYAALAECQASGKIAVLVDTEHSYDPIWAASLGVDNDTLIYVRTELAEEAVDAMVVALQSGEVGLIAIDSIASFLPKGEALDDKGNLKSSMEKTQMGRQAKFMSDALRKINALNKDTALLFLNQTRKDINMKFGDPTVTSGGESMKFYASLRIAMSAAEQRKQSVKSHVAGKEKDTKETTAIVMRAYLKKSKLSKPLRDIYFEFDLTTGAIDELGFVINQALDMGLIKTRKSGNVTVYTYGKIEARGYNAFKTKMGDARIATAKLRGAVLQQFTRDSLDAS